MADVIELNPKSADSAIDFMAVRRRISKCGNPIDIDAELRKLKEETGVPLATLKRCAQEVEREKKERQQEIRRQENGGDKKPLPGQDEQPKWAGALLTNKEGEIKDCPYNVATILRSHPEWRGRIKQNLLSGCVELDGAPMTDSQVFGVLEWHGKVMRMPIKAIHTVLSALKKVGADAGFHPVVDMLDALPDWDGTPRVDHMFSDFLGAQQDDYSAYVGRMLLCSMIARAYEPGCIMRRMPVLEGPENTGKSLFVRDLGHPWSAEISSNMESSKQFEEDVQGVWVAELMEMDALKKASASRIKAAISLRISRRREAYGMLSEDHPRSTVFVGTVNPNNALNLFAWDDENTRFFPLVVKNYNQEAFLAARPQLLAEAKAIMAENPRWWEESAPVQARAATLRSGRAAVDPWMEPIAEFLFSQGQAEVSIPMLLFDCLKIPIERQSQYEATRAGKILHSLQWVISGTTRNGPQSRTRLYRKVVHLEST